MENESSNIYVLRAIFFITASCLSDERSKINATEINFLTHENFVNFFA
jgi:hypothetical protein